MRRWLFGGSRSGLLIITLSGVLLPHQGEIMRSLNPTAYTHDADPGQVSLPQAVETVQNGHPDEPVLSATWDTDIVEVRTERATYTVDPSTGHEISRASAIPEWVAALDNLHRCLLSCQVPATCTGCPRRSPHRRWAVTGA